MRLLWILLLALVIPINAAYAAASGVCDSVDGHAQHGQHFGHHKHVHDQDHGGVGNGDPKQPSGSDHNHSHAHPLFTLMLPAQIEVHLPPEPAVAAASPRQSFVSVTPVRLERPPRSVLVA